MGGMYTMHSLVVSDSDQKSEDNSSLTTGGKLGKIIVGVKGTLEILAAWDVAQLVTRLPSVLEALGLFPRITKEAGVVASTSSPVWWSKSEHQEFKVIPEQWLA